MTEVHGGKWLKQTVSKLGKTHTQLANEMGIAAVTLRSWMYQKQPRIRSNFLTKLAGALGVTEANLRLNLGLEIQDGFDNNVEPYSMTRMIAEVPMFDLPIAAGGWADVSGQMLIDDPEQIRQGLFRVRVRGDSMQPVFMSEQIVEFRICRVGIENWPTGRHCYIQLASGDATLKTLVEVTETQITLQAINKRKYPKPLTADVAEVVRVGVAMSIVTPVN